MFNHSNEKEKLEKINEKNPRIQLHAGSKRCTLSSSKQFENKGMAKDL
jgi:hypothetical protein